MIRLIILIAVFIGVLALGAFLFWISGFNFDRRGEDVAYGALILLFAAGFFTGMYADMTRKNK